MFFCGDAQRKSDHCEWHGKNSMAEFNQRKIITGSF
jgi:hypothetical protein